MTDLISRADAIEAVLTYFIPRSHTGERGEYEEDFVRTIFNALPSADTVQGEWIKRKNNSYNSHRLTCPKCKKTFIMPKAWGVWKGCPSCWTKLNPPKGGDTE